MATLFEKANQILDEKVNKIVPENIKAGVTAFGVEGTLEELDTSDATATENDIANGKTAYVDGNKISGNIPVVNSTYNVPVDGVLHSGNEIITGGLTSNKQILASGIDVAAHISDADIAFAIQLEPENIKKDVTILGVTGTLEGSVINNQDRTITANGTYVAGDGYTGLGTVTVNVPQEGGGTTGARIFETEEDMRATTGEEGDLAIVYKSIVRKINSGERTKTLYFPKTVVLESPMEWVDYMNGGGDVQFQCMGDPNQINFDVSNWSDPDAGWASVSYSSSDGFTFTSSKSGDYVMTLLGAEMTFSFWSETEVCRNFMNIRELSFGGLFKYKNNQWGVADTQLTATVNDLLPDVVALGKDGVITGTTNIYNNIPISNIISVETNSDKYKLGTYVYNKQNIVGSGIQNNTDEGIDFFKNQVCLYKQYSNSNVPAVITARELKYTENYNIIVDTDIVSHKMYFRIYDKEFNLVYTVEEALSTYFKSDYSVPVMFIAEHQNGQKLGIAYTGSLGATYGNYKSDMITIIVDLSTKTSTRKSLNFPKNSVSAYNGLWDGDDFYAFCTCWNEYNFILLKNGNLAFNLTGMAGTTNNYNESMIDTENYIFVTNQFDVDYASDAKNTKAKIVVYNKTTGTTSTITAPAIGSSSGTGSGGKFVPSLNLDGTIDKTKAYYCDSYCIYKLTETGVTLLKNTQGYMINLYGENSLAMDGLAIYYDEENNEGIVTSSRGYYLYWNSDSYQVVETHSYDACRWVGGTSEHQGKALHLSGNRVVRDLVTNGNVLTIIDRTLRTDLKLGANTNNFLLNDKDNLYLIVNNNF